jgi:membrane protease YdiL (CAAX protease family)
LNLSQQTGNQGIPPFGIGLTLLTFGGGGLLLLFSTHVLIPFLSERTGYEPVIFWFITGGLLVFLPLIIAGYLILKREKAALDFRTFRERLRFRRMTQTDWLWAGGSLVAIGVLTVLLQFILEWIYGEVSMHPPFMAFEPLDAGRYWILALWLPVWILNIMGEEFLWRGVILPRHEISFGQYAWLVHALAWVIFHLAFGWVLLLLLTPILFILPFAAQKTGNSWVAVIIHAGINGPGFIAVSFGLV